MYLRRIMPAVITVVGMFSSPATAAASEAPYQLTTPTGTIAGTLSMPEGAVKPPVVLIVAGSGPTDRDGNQPPTFKLDMNKRLAAALAAMGIASVRYDKRGVGESKAALHSEADLRFDTEVDDAAAMLGKLSADGRFSSVSVAGHSEGSLLGMIAARRSSVAAFVSLEGAGFPIYDVLRTQLAPRLASMPDLVAKNDYILNELIAGRTVPDLDIPSALMLLYHPSVQPYLISWFKYDPRTEIAKLRCRVTIVQGTNDVQLPVENGKALAAANPSAALILVQGMTHVLTDDTATTLAGQATGAYADATRPLDPRVAQAIAGAVFGTQKTTSYETAGLRCTLAAQFCLT